MRTTLPAVRRPAKPCPAEDSPINLSDARRAGGDHRIAVHFRNRERRLVTLGGDWPGQHPAQRLAQRHRFFLGGCDAGKHGGAGLGHRGKGGRAKFPLGR